MCLVKKYNLDLKRQFLSNHCVATLKEQGLVDMCLFSGEGKPTLLGGYVLTSREAFNLGNALLNTSAFLDKATIDEKKSVINENIVMVYRLLKGINDEQAEKLKELFDIRIMKREPPKTDHGYIG